MVAVMQEPEDMHGGGLRSVAALGLPNRPSLQLVRAGDIQVDSYQRGLNMAHVAKIVAAFDWQLFFAVGISKRADGTLWVFDGQHRIAAVLQKFGLNELVPAIVVSGLSEQNEARMFYKMGTTRKAILPIERFRAQMMAREAGALAIHAIALKHGFSITGHSDVGTLNCVGALERLYYPQGRAVEAGLGELSTWEGPQRLDWVLNVAALAWGGRESVNADALMALSRFFAHRGTGKNAIDEARLVRSLQLFPPNSWTRRARELRTDTFVQMATEYNRGLRSRKVPMGARTPRAESEA